jgi:hypothetical protein
METAKSTAMTIRLIGTLVPEDERLWALECSPGARILPTATPRLAARQLFGVS